MSPKMGIGIERNEEEEEEVRGGGEKERKKERKKTMRRDEMILFHAFWHCPFLATLRHPR